MNHKETRVHEPGILIRVLEQGILPSMICASFYFHLMLESTLTSSIVFTVCCFELLVEFSDV